MKKILALHLLGTKSSLETVTEACLRFSPLVFARKPHWIFVDVTRSLPVLGDITGLQSEVQKLLDKLREPAQWALHSSSPTAQMLALTSPSQTRLSPAAIHELPIHFLLFAEGLKAFESFERNQVRELIETLQTLGFKTVAEFAELPPHNVSERWGELGFLLWQRCWGHVHEAFDVYEPAPVFNERFHFDFSCINLSLFLEALHSILERIEQRLLGRGAWAYEMHLHIDHEYSRVTRTESLQAAHPSSDAKLWLKLFSHKLSKLSFENPIREFRLEALSKPRHSRQLSLLNDEVEADIERLALLQTFLTTALGTGNVGFLEMRDTHLPERAWALGHTPLNQHSTKPKSATEALDQAVDLRVAQAPELPPRPTRLLNPPQKIHALEDFHFLFMHSERVETHWWEPEANCSRDYYVVQKDHQLLWIFCDLHTQEFFIHGYFD